MPSTAFLLTSLLVVLSPGTGAVFTVSTGLSQGRRGSLWAAFGCTLGILPHLAATLCGVAALLHASALAFQGLKWAGTAYLLHVAWCTWRDKAGLEVDGRAARIPAGRLVVRAVLINVLNPKLTFFFLAFLPQFVDPRAPAVGQLLSLSGFFMATTFAVFSAYGLLAHAFRRRIVGSARAQGWMRRGFALGYAGLAADLALAKDR